MYTVIKETIACLDGIGWEVGKGQEKICIVLINRVVVIHDLDCGDRFTDIYI